MPGGVNDMDLLLNDLSLHGQFSNVADFRAAVGRVIEMRAVAQRFKREIYAHRNVTNRRVNSALSLYEALQRLPRDQKLNLLLWLTKSGPFWEDVAQHNPDQWFQCGDEIVTDTAVGEAAYCCAAGIDYRLVSLEPSNWTYSPLMVNIEHRDAHDVSVQNYWNPSYLKNALQNTPTPVASWNDLETDARTRFQRLTFSGECFGHLNGQPFAPGVAKRILNLLDILNRLMGSYDDSGLRTSEGNSIYQDYFVGERARFSDSADTEKNEFRNQMTFRHPEQPGRYLFCTWHGKINHPPYRVHFAWPEQPGAPLYVVYVGLKITRR